MPTLTEVLFHVPAGIVLLLLATIVFDVVHFLLHQWENSSHPLLKAASALHGVHHQFLDRDLRIHREFIAANAWCHVIPEFLVQVLVTCLLGIFFSGTAVAVALSLELLVFLLIIKPTPGFDVNHHPVEKLAAYRPLYFCVPEYHLLHHVYPQAHFSSWIKTLDHLLGTGICLQGRQAVISGMDTPFGKQLAIRLQQAGCRLIPPTPNHADLQMADILVLCHDAASASGYRDMIETYCRIHADRRKPVEVWAVSHMDEFSTPETAAYARFARPLFSAQKVIYRHLVAGNKNPDARSADVLLRKVKKGFNYVPECWSLATLKHYGQFVLK